MKTSSRIKRLREYCERKNLDGFYIRDTAHIQWLTGVEQVFDSEQAHALLINARSVCIHTDLRYAQMLKCALREKSLLFEEDEKHPFQANAAASSYTWYQTDPSDESKNLIRVSTEALSHPRFAQSFFSQDIDGVIGVEDTISLREWEDLLKIFKRDRLCITTNALLDMRSVKDKREIRAMKRAQKITDKGFKYIIRHIKVGMTEEEVQKKLDAYLLSHGAESLSFSTIVAGGAHAASPHARPGKNRLEVGDAVVMDFGVVVGGYCSDMTRTVFLGEPSEKQRRAYAAIREANETVERVLRPGVTGKEMHELALRVLDEHGFGGTMGHGLGHGVGLEIHELPNLNARNDKALPAGAVVTVEPGIYIDDEFGMRLEDFGVITSDGYQVFTQSTHDMVIIDAS